MSPRTRLSKALRAPILQAADCIWITDDVLAAATNRFFRLSHHSIRHGSSVPGPLECRRRAGRRRMTQMTGHAPPSLLPDFSFPWHLWSPHDPMQWNWQAPSAETNAPEPQSQSQAPELDMFATAAQEAYAIERPTPTAGRLDMEDIEYTDVFAEFLDALHNAQPDSFSTICDTFGPGLKRELVLGSIDGEALVEKIGEAIEAICDTPIHNHSASAICAGFLKTVWEGISTCKVLSPQDLNPDIHGLLLEFMIPIISSIEMQRLAYDILCSIPYEQIVSGEEDSPLRLTISELLENWTSECFFPKGQQRNVPSTEAVLLVAKSFDHLGEEYSTALIRRLVDQIFEVVDRQKELNQETPDMELRACRQLWLSTISNMQSASLKFLIEIWNRTDCLAKPLKMRAASSIILNYWASHGLLKDPVGVRSTFQDYKQTATPEQDYLALLLSVVNKHREECWTKTMNVFEILRMRNKPHHIYNVLRSAQQLGLAFPASLLAKEIQLVSAVDVKAALAIYKLYPKLRSHIKIPLLLDGCPDMIIAMINDTTIAPDTVWETLGVPLHKKPRYLSGHCSKPLPKVRVSLIIRMAHAFAKAKHLYNRTAFRNVERCVMYLRRHRTPLPAEIGRALTFAAITRDLIGGGWVGEQRRSYVISLVAKAEGDEVARMLEHTFALLKERYEEEREVERRNANPLGLRSQID